MKRIRRIVATQLAALLLGLLGASPTAAFAPNQAALLSVSLQVSPAAGVDANGNLTYTAIVSNNSFEIARTVHLAASLPADMIPISASAASGACTFGSAGGALTADCWLGNLGAFRSTTVTLVAHPTTIAIKTVTVNVSAFNAAGVTATASSSLPEVAIADVQVTLDDAPDPAQVGQSLVYSATVTNIGDDMAQGVALAVVLPSGVTLLVAAPSVGSCANAGSTVVCSLGSLDAGRSETVAIKVQPAGQGFIYVTAGVSTATVPDPNLANNSATVRTYVNP